MLMTKKIIVPVLVGLIISLLPSIIAREIPSFGHSATTQRGMMFFNMHKLLLTRIQQEDTFRVQVILNQPIIRILINFKDSLGKTALHYAAELGLVDITQSLLNREADATLTDAQDDTPLDLAEKNNLTAIVELLSS